LRAVLCLDIAQANVGWNHIDTALAETGLNMEPLLDLLNPAYVLGNIVREAGSAVNACDFSQLHTWLLIASSLCVGQAAYTMFIWGEKKLTALRKD
jgi:hypothetical protein